MQGTPCRAPGTLRAAPSGGAFVHDSVGGGAAGPLRQSCLGLGFRRLWGRCRDPGGPVPLRGRGTGLSEQQSTVPLCVGPHRGSAEVGSSLSFRPRSRVTAERSKAPRDPQLASGELTPVSPAPPEPCAQVNRPSWARWARLPPRPVRAALALPGAADVPCVTVNQPAMTSSSSSLLSLQSLTLLTAHQVTGLCALTVSHLVLTTAHGAGLTPG